jgi:hypothetical protein
MKASHAEQLRLRASQQPSRGSAANIATKSTLKAQNDPFGHGGLARSNGRASNEKTRPWLPDGRSLHLNMAEWQKEGVRGSSRQSATLALPRYHGTERSRANASSGKEKETPCVAAPRRVAISVNSLVARREWAGYREPFTAAPAMAAGRVGMPVALEPCVMMERLTPHEMKVTAPTVGAARWGATRRHRCPSQRSCKSRSRSHDGWQMKKSQRDESSKVGCVWQRSKLAIAPGCDDWTGAL